MKAKDPKQQKEKQKAQMPVPRDDSGNDKEPTPEVAQTAEAGGSPPGRTGIRASLDFKARGEPFVWIMGGALALGVLMIVGFSRTRSMERHRDVLSGSGGSGDAQKRWAHGRRAVSLGELPPLRRAVERGRRGIPARHPGGGRICEPHALPDRKFRHLQRGF